MKKRVPKLRFLEFSGEWKEKKFADCVQILSKLVDPKEKRYENLPHIGPGNIESSTGRLLKYNLVKNDNLISGKYLFGKKDVIYGKINPQLKKVVFPHFNGLCSADAYPLTAKENEILPAFLFNYLLTDDFSAYTISVSMRTGMPKINREDLDKYLFILPDVIEQQKIADFLSTVDNIIASEQRILDDLQLKKKGLMQKLFSRELRFKDKNGKKFPEWEEKKLGYVADILSGKRIPVGDTFAKDDTGLKYITVSDMDEKYVNSENIQFISSRVESKIKKYKVKTGDIIIAIVGATIGKLNMIPSSLNNANLTENCDKFTNYKSVIPEFLYSLLKSDSVIKEIDSQKTVSAQPKLALDRLRNFTFLFPSIPEQQKIAECLCLLDNVIEEQRKVVAGWKLRKKGLLQQMFV